LGSEAAQEGHQAGILLPGFARLGPGDFALGEGIGFRFQVTLCIDVSGIQRNMTEPTADGVDFHTGAQEVSCGRVAQLMF